MPETCGYLIPDKSFKTGEFKKLVKKILDGSGVTNGYYEKEEETLAAGRKSFLILSENINNQPTAFEYAKIHDSINRRLVPEEFGSGANCSKCGQNIDGPFIDSITNLYEQEYDSGTETDMAQMETICDNCGYINLLSDVKFNNAIAITNQYFQFVNIETDFNPGAITAISKKLGCNLKVFYGRF